jgi:predicted AAA+ superfamily ATPase
VLQAPKVYFYDTGLVEGDEGVRFENLVATALLKHVQYQYDVQGKEASLHYIRTKDDAEVDFALSEKNELTHLVECKLTDDKPHRSLKRFAAQFPKTQAVQLLRDLKHSFDVDRVQIKRADEWLNDLTV